MTRQRPLRRGETQCLKAGVRRALATVKLVREVAQAQRTWKVLEVFAGMAEVTVQAGRLAGWQPLQPFELTMGDDLR